MIIILYLLIVDVSLVMTKAVEEGLGSFTGVTNTKENVIFITNYIDHSYNVQMIILQHQ